MAHKLKPSAKTRIEKLIDQSTQPDGIPGISVIISNTKGENLIDYSSGVTGNTEDEKLTTNHLFNIMSCTKLVVAIALLQLWEQGKVDLDDPKIIEKYAKELVTLPVASLTDDDSILLKKRVNNITLRNLLTHTSGLCYPFAAPVVDKFINEFSLYKFNTFKGPFAKLEDHIIPLAFEPGTKWRYGVGIDWVGIIIERITGMTLGDYFNKFIFEPIGMKETSFLPTEDQFGRLVNLYDKDPETGEYKPNKIGFRKENYKGKTVNDIFHTGGGGLYSTPLEYIKFLHTLLNNGVSPITGNRILKKETVDLVFTNQLPEWPNFIRGIYDSTTDVDHSNDELDPKNIYYPQRNQPPQGWGLSLLLNLEENIDTGRSKNSGCWFGALNWYYWIDREKGITGLVAGQIDPWGDKIIFKLLGDVEKEIYKNLV